MSDHTNSPVKMLVSIVDRGRGANLTAYYNKKYPHTSFLAMGVGTASTAIMDMLGLDSAFTMRLTGIGSLLHAALMQSGDIPTPLLASDANAEPKRKENLNEMTLDNAYSLILAVAEPGYTEQIMEAARDAGATGGTVMHARGVGHGAAEHFLSLTIQPEKEIISILTPSDKRIPIMRAINEKYGLRSEAKAMILSLPVEDLVQVH